MIYEIKFAHGESNVFAISDIELAPQTEVILRSDKGNFYGKIVREISEEANLEIHHTIVREVMRMISKLLQNLKNVLNKPKIKFANLSSNKVWK